jgi:hypothetical protein
VSPATAGDDVDLGTGDLSATLGTFTGSVDIGSSNIQLNADGTASLGGGDVNIDSSGRLLVGTSSDFTGSNLQVIDAGGGEITIGRNDATVEVNDDLGHIFFAANDTGTGAGAYASISCFADATHSGGPASAPTRLQFSTTADGVSSPTERMKIANNGTSFFQSNENVIGAMSATAAGTAVRLYYGAYSAANFAGTVCYTVWTNGNVVNANNSYGSLSDAKLKENIVDASSQWDDLKAIQVRNYNFIEGQTHTQIGVVAQEVELVSPGLVSESPDLDDDGNDLGTVTKSVNYSVLYMKAVKALQEAMTRIEALEAENGTLSARLDALEGGAS